MAARPADRARRRQPVQGPKVSDPGNAIYEGAGRLTGTFEGTEVSGVAWLEEKVVPRCSRRWN
jgi:hypothetical protein